jgi:hypothetical protein
MQRFSTHTVFWVSEPRGILASSRAFRGARIDLESGKMCRQRSVFLAFPLVFSLLLVASTALAGARIEREFDLGSGGRFVLDTDSGRVSISGTSGSTARVVITSRKDDLESLFDVKFEHRPGELEVNVEKKSKLSSVWNWRNDGLRFEVWVPRDTEIDIDTAGGSIELESIERDARLDTSGGSITAREVGGDVLADTSGGSIEVSDVRGSVDADTSGGSIEIDNVGGQLRADTSGGSIRINDVAGDIEADTSGGSIRIEGAGGEVEADTSGGGVQVTFTPGNAEGGRISSSGGTITVTLDPSVSLSLDASASGGSVDSEVPITVQGKISRSSLKGEIGGGGAELKIRASGGGIKIRSL